MATANVLIGHGNLINVLNHMLVLLIVLLILLLLNVFILLLDMNLLL